MKSILSALSQQSTEGTWAHFRAGQSSNPYASHYRKPFAFSPISSTQSHRLPYGLPSSSLKALRHCHVLHKHLYERRRWNLYPGNAVSTRRPRYQGDDRDCLPFGDCLSAPLADLASHGTSTILHLRSSYRSILAPDRLALAVPIPLTVPLNRVHCPQRFIPNPFRMVGRILVVEHQVALSSTSLLGGPMVRRANNYENNSNYNIYLCNFMSQLTPAACAALEWRRSRNGKDVAVPAIVNCFRSKHRFQLFGSQSPRQYSQLPAAR